MIVEQDTIISDIVNTAFGTRVAFIARYLSVDDMMSDTSHYGCRNIIFIIDLDLSEQPGETPVHVGIEDIERLKSDPYTESFPLLAVSSRRDTAHLIAALDAGADDYLVKPLSPRELTARISSVFRRF